MKLSLVALVVFGLLAGASTACSRRVSGSLAQRAEHAFARVSEGRLNATSLARRAPGQRLYVEPVRTDLR